MFKISMIITMIFTLNLTSVAQAKDNNQSGGSLSSFELCVLDGGTSETSGNIITCCVPIDAFYKRCTSCVKGTSSCRDSTVWVFKDSGATGQTPKPPTLRDRINKLKTNAPARLKAMSPNKTPKVKPQKMKARPVMPNKILSR